MSGRATHFRLTLVRHGDTEWSVNGRHTGSKDLPLLDSGRAAAVRLEPRLAGLEVDALLVSPLQRARETAALAGWPDGRIVDDLREYDYGDYEGLTSAGVRAQDPDWQLWRDGCPGGETPAQILARAKRFIALARAAGTHVLAFSHGHFIRAVVLAYLDLPLLHGEQFHLETCAVSQVMIEGRGPQLSLWNDTGHLR